MRYYDIFDTISIPDCEVLSVDFGDDCGSILRGNNVQTISPTKSLAYLNARNDIKSGYDKTLCIWVE